MLSLCVDAFKSTLSREEDNVVSLDKDRKVNGTPTFFINGVRHDNSYALETLLAAIEAAMPS